MIYEMDLDSRIEELRLSVRATNCLLQNNINTLGELLSLSDDELVKIRNLGAGTFKELKRLRAEAISLGLWQMDIPRGEIHYFIDEHGVKRIDKKIKELNLSVRAKHGILQNKISFASELRYLDESVLASTRNLGEKTIREIMGFIDTLSFEEAVVGVKRKPLKLERLIESILSDYRHCQIRFDELTVARQLRRALLSFESTLDEPIEFPNFWENQIGMLNSIYSALFFRNLIKGHIYQVIKLSAQSINLFMLKKSLPQHIGHTEIINEIVREMVSDKQLEFTTEGIKIWEETIERFINGIEDPREKTLIMKRFEGCSLEEVGGIIGVTRERVRQVEAKILRKRPKLVEDKYKDIFETYSLSKDEFTTIFGENIMTYFYLNIVYDKGSKSFEDIIDDTTFSLQTRKLAERLHYKDYINVDSVWVKKTKSEIIKFLLRNSGNDETEIDKFQEIFIDFLLEHELTDLLETSMESRYLETAVQSHSESLWKFGRKFRFYDASSYDLNYLFEQLALESYHDVEITTLKLFREHQQLMDEYDIRDEYELHNLLKKHYPVPENSKIEFAKMPTLKFGRADRDMQVLNILIEHAPISRLDLCLIYEEMYGARHTTVMGSYLGRIEEYYHGDLYDIELPAIPNEHFEILSTILTDDFYYFSEITDLYLETIENADKRFINSYNLKRLGFRSNSSYVFSEKYNSIEGYFKSLLLENDMFLYDEKLARFNKIQSFYTVLQNLREDLVIIEYEKDKYVNYSKLGVKGITKDQLRSYAVDVLSFLGEDYFTIKSLREKGFEHPLDELGFDDWFYSSLIRIHPNINYRRYLSIFLFKQTTESVELRGLLELLLSSKRKIDIYDLLDFLNTVYGIRIEKHNLINICKNASLYYDNIMEKVYLDYEEYYEEL